MNIKRVQTELNARGFGPLEVDGIAGAKTYTAVKAFQAANGLTADGQVGPATLSKLFPVQEAQSRNLAIRAMQIAQSKVGVRELTGNNDGPEVEAYLKAVGLGKGYSWCMAFIVWCYDQAAQQLGVKNPLVRTGGCMKQWNEYKGKKVKPEELQEGDVAIMDLGGGAGHVFIVTQRRTSVVDTVEGNTNNNGSANGDGVYNRTRTVGGKIIGGIRVEIEA